MGYNNRAPNNQSHTHGFYYFIFSTAGFYALAYVVSHAVIAT